MNNDFKNKRKYERLFFSAEDGIVARFSINKEEPNSFSSTILNISIGGMHFTLPRSAKQDINVGDILVMNTITGNEALALDVAVEIEIKWILDHEFLNSIGYGCEFINIAEDVRDQIQTVVEQKPIGHKNG